MEKIKILGIAPYQEMEPLMRDIAKSYENLELYTFTGFYKNAIQFAKAFPDKEFDVIISRGGTADLVRSLNAPPGRRWSAIRILPPGWRRWRSSSG